MDGITLHKPSVKLLVNYECQMRKEVVEQFNMGQDFAEELGRVAKNADVRERHFSTPLAVSSATQSLQQGGGGSKKGEGYFFQEYKGKGRERERKERRERRGWSHSSTPPALMADKYAMRGITRKKDAKEDAACRICLGPTHPTYEHPAEDGQKPPGS